MGQQEPSPAFLDGELMATCAEREDGTLDITLWRERLVRPAAR